ncbi:hypothetical protein PCE1_002521 [Barthelona sp. PCE]
MTENPPKTPKFASTIKVDKLSRLLTPLLDTPSLQETSSEVVQSIKVKSNATESRMEKLARRLDSLSNHTLKLQAERDQFKIRFQALTTSIESALYQRDEAVQKLLESQTKYTESNTTLTVLKERFDDLQTKYREEMQLNHVNNLKHEEKLSRLESKNEMLQNSNTELMMLVETGETIAEQLDEMEVELKAQKKQCEEHVMTISMAEVDIQSNLDFRVELSEQHEQLLMDYENALSRIRTLEPLQDMYDELLQEREDIFDENVELREETKRARDCTVDLMTKIASQEGRMHELDVMQKKNMECEDVIEDITAQLDEAGVYVENLRENIKESDELNAKQAEKIKELEKMVEDQKSLIDKQSKLISDGRKREEDLIVSTERLRLEIDDKQQSNYELERRLLFEKDEKDTLLTTVTKVSTEKGSVEQELQSSKEENEKLLSLSLQNTELTAQLNANIKILDMMRDQNDELQKENHQKDGSITALTKDCDHARKETEQLRTLLEDQENINTQLITMIEAKEGVRDQSGEVLDLKHQLLESQQKWSQERELLSMQYLDRDTAMIADISANEFTKIIKDQDHKLKQLKRKSQLQEVKYQKDVQILMESKEKLLNNERKLKILITKLKRKLVAYTQGAVEQERLNKIKELELRVKHANKQVEEAKEEADGEREKWSDEKKLLGQAIEDKDKAIASVKQRLGESDSKKQVVLSQLQKARKRIRELDGQLSDKSSVDEERTMALKHDIEVLTKHVQELKFEVGNGHKELNKKTDEITSLTQQLEMIQAPEPVIEYVQPDLFTASEGVYVALKEIEPEHLSRIVSVLAIGNHVDGLSHDEALHFITLSVMQVAVFSLYSRVVPNLGVGLSKVIKVLQQINMGQVATRLTDYVNIYGSTPFFKEYVSAEKEIFDHVVDLTTHVCNCGQHDYIPNVSVEEKSVSEGLQQLYDLITSRVEKLDDDIERMTKDVSEIKHRNATDATHEEKAQNLEIEIVKYKSRLDTMVAFISAFSEQLRNLISEHSKRDDTSQDVLEGLSSIMTTIQQFNIDVLNNAEPDTPSKSKSKVAENDDFDMMSASVELE